MSIISKQKTLNIGFLLGPDHYSSQESGQIKVFAICQAEWMLFKHWDGNYLDYQLRFSKSTQSPMLDAVLFSCG